MSSTTTTTTKSDHQQPTDDPPSSSFDVGGADADLAARLAAPVSPTTDKASAEARRRTSEWRPPAPAAPQRAFSFDHEEHKRHMMLASASGGGGHPVAAPAAGEHRAQGFTEGG